MRSTRVQVCCISIVTPAFQENVGASDLGEQHVLVGIALFAAMCSFVCQEADASSEVLLNPRFGVEQEREDGSTKVRAIDNFSWSASAHEQSPGGVGARRRIMKKGSVNGYTTATEKIAHDTLDAFAEALVLARALLGCIPGLLKARHQAIGARDVRHCSACAQADVDSAFRRIPVLACHRWACGVAMKVAGQVGLATSSSPVAVRCLAYAFRQIYVSTHNACPFGAVASVYVWERIGAAIAHLIRKLLKIGVLRYVDDFFAAERYKPEPQRADTAYHVLLAGRRPWNTHWDA